MAATKSHRILVVDDQRVVRQYLLLLLERAGYEVVLAANGREAIQTLAAHTVDLVLTDLKMPFLDGFDVLRYVQQSPSPVPVVLMTAYGSPEVAEQAARLGAFAYLPKPFELETLQQILAHAMSARAS